MNSYPLTRDLVLIGGGHTHALVLRAWGMNPLPGARLTVINPGPTAAYSGMLPGFVAGHYDRAALDIDLLRLARFAGARLIDGAVTALDPKTRTITVPGRPAIAYDLASVDVGITSTMPEIPDFAAHGIPAKPLGAFASRWQGFCETAAAPEIAIIGGGVAGAELALAMAHRLRDRDPVLRLIDRGRVLDHLGYKARQQILAALSIAGIDIIEEAQVTEVFADGVVLQDGRMIRSDFTVGAAGAQPHDWIARTGLALQDGFLAVNPQLQTDDPAVFAVGDCAHMQATPRPKAGVFAVRQAPVLFDNLRAALSGGDLRPYRPQRDYLKLISLGSKSALAEKFGTARSGPLLWRLKDAIDRRFMDQFTALPQMQPPALPRTRALGLAPAEAAQPMCGGCGAKVGRGALQASVGAGFGDDAAEIHPGQVITTDHLRALLADPVVMARIAAVHALGDIWAMGARPEAATMTLILPRSAPRLQQRTLTEVTEAATAVISAAGGRIVGGHSSLGEELTIGFTITGQVKSPITLAGARPGDALILTKPLGSGVIMAAEMAGRADPADVIACLNLMMQPQAAAAKILARAHAMTDVTGFGLAGHLRGICEASGTGALISAEALPVMAGARGLLNAGVHSSLQADNITGAGPITGPHEDLLFDPQTAGGLLAAVTAKTAEKLLARLRDAGYQAAIIGELRAGAEITMR